MRYTAFGIALAFLVGLFVAVQPAQAANATRPDAGPTYDVGDMPPTNSTLKVAVGDMAPDFTLPSIQGEDVTLSDYRGEKNVVLSFVPAAFTPVCSDQWPGYCLAESLFERHDAILLGISTDNIPSLYAWTQQMENLWFPVLSDFWPHGEVAEKYGVLRSAGVAERALFVIDKQGVIRYIDVHDINARPDLGELAKALEQVHAEQQ
jgi:peroxiredoxin (alkyl hydroperoxide reductase subunit C)